MRRSFREIVELVGFGLIALLLVTGLIWLIGWVLGLIGIALKFVAGIIWSLLRFVVPITIVAGLVYALVRFLLNRNNEPATPGPNDGPYAPTKTDTDSIDEASTKPDNNLDSLNPEILNEHNVLREASTPESNLDNRLDDTKDKKV